MGRIKARSISYFLRSSHLLNLPELLELVVASIPLNNVSPKPPSIRFSTLENLSNITILL